MEVFKDVRFQDLVSKYKNDEFAFVADLMNAKLLKSAAPQCHSAMQTTRNDPWRWRCSYRLCGKKVSVCHGSFFQQYRNRLDIFLALYMWSCGRPSGEFKRECGLADHTMIKLQTQGRAILKKYSGVLKYV